MRRGDLILVADRAGGDFAGKPRPAVIVQAEPFAGVDTIVVCLLTSRTQEASLLRVPVAVTAESGLRLPSHIAIEKLTSIRLNRVGQAIGRISTAATLALNRSLAVFLGFA